MSGVFYPVGRLEASGAAFMPDKTRTLKQAPTHYPPIDVHTGEAATFVLAPTSV